MKCAKGLQVVPSYLTTCCGFHPGRKRTLLVGDALFAAGAVLMGLAPGISTLITGASKSCANHVLFRVQDKAMFAAGGLLLHLT